MVIVFPRRTKRYKTRFPNPMEVSDASQLRVLDGSPTLRRYRLGASPNETR
jgi:hypothetical protein